MHNECNIGMSRFFPVQKWKNRVSLSVPLKGIFLFYFTIFPKAFHFLRLSSRALWNMWYDQTYVKINKKVKTSTILCVIKILQSVKVSEYGNSIRTIYKNILFCAHLLFICRACSVVQRAWCIGAVTEHVTQGLSATFSRRY